MLDSKEISAVELTEQYLDRIENSDKEINSYITVCKENALADAKKAQEVIDSGNSGAFTGLPISVKDNICTLGVKTTCASHMLDDFIPPYNATVMEKLKKDNIVMLGKTNMDEFAMGGSSQTSYFGGVKNPYDLTRVTGGSSGGGATPSLLQISPPTRQAEKSYAGFCFEKKKKKESKRKDHKVI